MSLFLRSELAHGVAELDGVSFGVSEIDRATKFMVDFEDGMTVGSPPFPVPFQILGCRRIESDVVSPPGQSGTLIEIGSKFGADGIVVDFPKSDHALLPRRRGSRRIEEVLAPPTFGGWSRDGLDQFEAHDLGIKLEVGLGVPDGNGDVMESHG